MQVRAEAKDYIDMGALLTDGRIDLPLALDAGRAIYGEQFAPQNTLKARSYFGDGNRGRLPRAVDLDRLVWRR